MIEATKIYARFAVDVYDDFGDSYSEQEYYRKEHADEELRATKHALWMARAKRACEKAKYLWVRYELWQAFPPKIAMKSFEQGQWVERKCRQKAEEFK